jgi:uncharacterized membrane protein YfcA
LTFVAVGFVAQLVDGALGMAFGLISSTILLGLGVPPATASANVHAAELLTSAASGAAHWRAGNVDRQMVKRLAIPGAIGGAIGATLLAALPVHYVRPLVSLYLLAMSILILLRVVHGWTRRPSGRLVPLGFVSGALDAIGGGWGALVTSSLIGGGHAPRQTIGSASLAEFFVTAAVTAAFVLAVEIQFWPTVAGLVVGGIVAAPLAAIVVRKAPERPLMLAVGVLVLGLSLAGILRLLL